MGGAIHKRRDYISNILIERTKEVVGSLHNSNSNQSAKELKEIMRHYGRNAESLVIKELFSTILYIKESSLSEYSKEIAFLSEELQVLINKMDGRYILNRALLDSSKEITLSYNGFMKAMAMDAYSSIIITYLLLCSKNCPFGDAINKYFVKGISSLPLDKSNTVMEMYVTDIMVFISSHKNYWESEAAADTQIKRLLAFEQASCNSIVVLSPLFSAYMPESSTEMRTVKSVAIQEAVSVSSILMDLGCIVSVSEKVMTLLLKSISEMNKVPMNSEEVARMLINMANCDDCEDINSQRIMSKEYLKSLNVELPPEILLKNWDVPVVVKSVSSFDPSLQWKEVFLQLDCPEFKLKSQRAFDFIVRVYQETGGAVFPYELFNREWKNQKGKLSLIEYSLSSSSVFSFSFSPHVIKLTDSLLPCPMEYQAWLSIDLIDALVSFLDTAYFDSTHHLLQPVIKAIPLVLLTTLTASTYALTYMKRFLLEELIERVLYMEYNTNTVFVLNEVKKKHNEVIKSVVCSVLERKDPFPDSVLLYVNAMKLVGELMKNPSNVVFANLYVKNWPNFPSSPQIDTVLTERYHMYGKQSFISLLDFISTHADEFSNTAKPILRLLCHLDDTQREWMNKNEGGDMSEVVKKCLCVVLKNEKIAAMWKEMIVEQNDTIINNIISGSINDSLADLIGTWRNGNIFDRSIYDGFVDSIFNMVKKMKNENKLSIVSMLLNCVGMLIQKRVLEEKEEDTFKWVLSLMDASYNSIKPIVCSMVSNIDSVMKEYPLIMEQMNKPSIQLWLSSAFSAPSVSQPTQGLTIQSTQQMEYSMSSPYQPNLGFSLSQPNAATQGLVIPGTSSAQSIQGFSLPSTTALQSINMTPTMQPTQGFMLPSSIQSTEGFNSQPTQGITLQPIPQSQPKGVPPLTAGLSINPSVPTLSAQRQLYPVAQNSVYDLSPSIPPISMFSPDMAVSPIRMAKEAEGENTMYPYLLKSSSAPRTMLTVSSLSSHQSPFAPELVNAAPLSSDTETLLKRSMNGLGETNWRETSLRLFKKCDSKELCSVVKYFAENYISRQKPFFNLFYDMIIYCNDSLIERYLLEACILYSFEIIKKNSDSDISKKQLQNLGCFIGLLTIRRDQVLPQRLLNLKSLLNDHKGKESLGLVLPFVCDIIRYCSESKAFNNIQQPWLHSILVMLVGIDQDSNVKSSIKSKYVDNILDQFHLSDEEKGILIREAKGTNGNNFSPHVFNSNSTPFNPLSRSNSFKNVASTKAPYYPPSGGHSQPPLTSIPSSYQSTPYMPNLSQQRVLTATQMIMKVKPNADIGFIKYFYHNCHTIQFAESSIDIQKDVIMICMDQIQLLKDIIYSSINKLVKNKMNEGSEIEVVVNKYVEDSKMMIKLNDDVKSRFYSYFRYYNYDLVESYISITVDYIHDCYRRDLGYNIRNCSSTILGFMIDLSPALLPVASLPFDREVSLLRDSLQKTIRQATELIQKDPGSFYEEKSSYQMIKASLLELYRSYQSMQAPNYDFMECILKILYNGYKLYPEDTNDHFYCQYICCLLLDSASQVSEKFARDVAYSGFERILKDNECLIDMPFLGTLIQRQFIDINSIDDVFDSFIMTYAQYEVPESNFVLRNFDTMIKELMINRNVLYISQMPKSIRSSISALSPSSFYAPSIKKSLLRIQYRYSKVIKEAQYVLGFTSLFNTWMELYNLFNNAPDEEHTVAFILTLKEKGLLKNEMQTEIMMRLLLQIVMQNGESNVNGVDGYCCLCYALYKYSDKDSKSSILLCILSAVVCYLGDAQKKNDYSNYDGILKILLSVVKTLFEPLLLYCSSFSSSLLPMPLMITEVSIFLNALQSIQPMLIPSFSYHWVTLLSYTPLLQVVAAIKDATSSTLLKELIQGYLRFIFPLLDDKVVPPFVEEHLQSLTRLLLQLHSLYPDLLAYNYYSFTLMIPYRYSQLHNIIVSAIPAAVNADGLAENDALLMRTAVGHWDAPLLKNYPIREMIDLLLIQKQVGAMEDLKQIVMSLLKTPPLFCSAIYEITCYIYRLIYDKEINKSNTIRFPILFYLWLMSEPAIDVSLLIGFYLDQIRYPSTDTRCFQMVVTTVLTKSSNDSIDITLQMLLDRCYAPGPKPWGLDMLLKELMGNAKYNARIMQIRSEYIERRKTLERDQGAA